MVKTGNGGQSKLDTYGITEANNLEKQKERCSHHRHTVFRSTVDSGLLAPECFQIFVAIVSIIDTI